MGAIYGAGMISLRSKLRLLNFRLLKSYDIIYTSILRNRMQKMLDAIIGESQSAAIKNRTILHTFYTIRDEIDVANKLNSNLALIYLIFFLSFRQIRLRFHDLCKLVLL